MITVEGLQKRYGQRLVLDIPHLELRRGERYALLGANGSGKSTLLRILAGVLPPDGGSVHLGKAAGGVGYMPQKPYIFGFSVLKNVKIACGNDEKAARAALERVGMAELSAARGRTLSGGEAQRVALGRMLCVKRELLLLDEPTSATDVAAGDLVERALLDYGAETGCTMVIATHSPSQAVRLCGPVVFLHQGQVAETGPARQVLSAPRSEAARDFLNHWTV